jgi:hypothetical protein
VAARAILPSSKLPALLTTTQITAHGQLVLHTQTLTFKRSSHG